jgi:RNA 3'-terminal phosphate cyclase (ATP)
MIQLDGSQGEGGGQILRTALALSLCTEQPFRISNIRAGRQKPGLLRQHLTAVKAAEQISNATVSGSELGSRELTFKPQVVQPGKYQFAVGTAGSATLVFQTVLPALLTAGASSTLICQGGTHNPFAPPFDFLERCFAPQLQRMGVAFKFQLRIPGFFPAGGGEFHARVEPTPKLIPISILEKGALQDKRVSIYLANLPQNIADREIAILQKQLSWPEENFVVRNFPDAPGPGNVVLIEERYEHVTEITTGFGEKGVSAEQVAQDTVTGHRRYQTSSAVVGDYLSDQLLIPFALAGNGEFITAKPSSHAVTNAQTIAKFIDRKIDFHEETGKTWRCVIE